MSSSLLVLSSDDVIHLTKSLSALDLTRMIGRTLHSITQPTSSHGIPMIQNPTRISTETPSHKLLYMPSRCGGSTAIKVVAVPKPTCKAEGLPATTLLFDEESGRCKAVINSGVLTGLRTAAASALATLMLGDPWSNALVVFGSGMQAYYHATLILQLFPDVRQVSFIVRKKNARAVALQKRMVRETQGVNVFLLGPGQWNIFVQTADIICTCIPSDTPLFGLELKPNVHINAIGSYTPSMLDFPPALIAGPNALIPTIVVDSREACLKEAGELINSGIAPYACIELGKLVDESGEVNPDLLAGTQMKSSKRSLYKGVGIGGMDVAIAEYIYESALKARVGTTVQY